MVIPNVGAFIAWGLITALFIPTGWTPNERIAALVDPMITYLLPLLLAYSGGRLVHGHRGGVIGTLGAIGVIVGADIPMFLGAMIMGPLSAWLMKRFDRLIEGRIPPGFEMVVNNFSLGFLGLGLTLAGFLGIGPIISEINTIMLAAINWLVSTGWLPLLSLLNEPAKVLFLNNVIDQGMYYPLGLQQAAEHGKSIFFMVASNPGPGLGLLTAFWFFGQNRVIRDSAPGAIIIHFLGGIHEIYFPYVLMKPVTILAMIAGGMAGILTFMLTGAGLVAGPSPGSIFSYLILTPRGNYLGVIAGVLIAAVVSFLVTSALLRFGRGRETVADDALAQQSARSQAMKAEGKAVLGSSLGEDVAPATTGVAGVSAAAAQHAPRIDFACDAGMGSSTMGASIFKKKLKEIGREDVLVTNHSIENIPEDADIVVVHRNLADRARRARPRTQIVTIENYLNDPAIGDLLVALTQDKESNDAR